jgi:hypothetical protein
MTTTADINYIKTQMGKRHPYLVYNALLKVRKDLSNKVKSQQAVKKAEDKKISEQQHKKKEGVQK